MGESGEIRKDVVLVVDDEPEIRRMVTMALSSEAGRITATTEMPGYSADAAATSSVLLRSRLAKIFVRDGRRSTATMLIRHAER